MTETAHSWEFFYRRGPTEDRHQPRGVVVEHFKRLRSSGIRRVLDLGCGDGRHLHYLASQGFDPVGIDYALTALMLARSWMSEDGMGAKVVNANMSALPVRTAFFEAVLCTQVLNHGLLVDIRRTIGEISRVLIPGGWLFLTVSVWDAGSLSEDDFVQIEPDTFLPLNGDEKDIPHYLFSPETLAREFSAFELPEEIFWVRDNVLGLLARKWL